MTYFADGTPYTYLAGTPELGAVNVGWLDVSEPFATGDVAPDLVTLLRRRCQTMVVNPMRGFHRCNLCAAAAGSTISDAVKVSSGGGDFFVGNAEIRVRGADGTVYAAPNMIIHYVEAHGYRPPDVFHDALAR